VLTSPLASPPRPKDASSRRPLPAVDAGVPQLALLHRDRLAETLAGVWGAADPVADAQVEYLAYTPGRSLVLHVSAQVGGRARHAVIRSGSAITDRARATARWLPDLDAMVHEVADDPDLPLMRATRGQLSRVLPGSLGERVRVGARSEPARVLAYVPATRATLAVEPFVLKTYASRWAYATAVTANGILSGTNAFRTPAFLGGVPDHLMTVQPHVAARPAERHEALRLALDAGLLLAQLHGTVTTAAPVRDSAVQLQAASKAVDVLRAVLPSHAVRATALLRTLATRAPSASSLVLSHGDFSIDQLLVDGDGSIVVTDVDKVCRAPAALDVSSFAANLMSGRHGDDDHVTSVLDALCASHRPPPHLRWHLAVALLRRCDRPFRRWKKHWDEKCIAILDLAETVSAS
jgi:hypothetical protein